MDEKLFEGLTRKEILQKMAAGYYVIEDVVVKGKNGSPEIRRKKRFIPPDMKAIRELQDLESTEKDGTKRFPWLEITDDGRILLRTAKMAEVMTVSERQIMNWAAKGAPKERRGWWDVAAIIKWRGRAAGVTGGPTAEADKLAADVRLKTAKAKTEEIKLRRLMGNMVPAALVESAVTELFACIRTSLLNLSLDIQGRLASEYPDIVIPVKKLLEERIENALNQLASADGILDRATGNLEKGSPEPAEKVPGKLPATGKADRKPVGRQKPGAARERKSKSRKVEH